MKENKYTLTLSGTTLALIEFDLAINTSKHERMAEACDEPLARDEAEAYRAALEELTKSRDAAIIRSVETRAKARAWLDNLDEKYASMSDDEQAKWLKETEDGRSYTAIMNSSWREDWEEGIEQEYLRRFGE